MLPYEERKILHQTLAKDELLRIDAQQELTTYFSRMGLQSGLDPETLSTLTLKVIDTAFQEDGLNFSRFLSDSETDDSAPVISDSVRAVLTSQTLTREARWETARTIDRALREVFYNSTPTLRRLLQRLSRAYGIAFTLMGEPRVLRYFDDLLTETWLYVGADVVISALSERYVQPQDQHTRNLLKATSVAGAQLILIAPVLQEVLGHLRKSDKEYQHYIEPIANVDSYEVAREVPHILIRAFLYTRVFKNDPRPYSWEQFISQFCDYRILHKPRLRDMLGFG